jgi:hypothetical protein
MEFSGETGFARSLNCRLIGEEIMKLSEPEALSEILFLLRQGRCRDCETKACSKRGCDCECHKLLTTLRRIDAGVGRSQAEAAAKPKDRQIEALSIESRAFREVLDCEMNHAEEIIEEYRNRKGSERVFARCLRCRNDDLQRKLDELLGSSRADS